MRQFLTASLLLVLLPAFSRADDRDKALDLINQAIKAHGGETALERAQKYVRNAAGTTNLAGKDVTFSDELIVAFPDRLRLTIDATSGTQKTRIVQIVNGDKGFVAGGGGVSEMGKERLAEMREELYLLWLATLTPLKRESSLTLTPLAEEKVNDRAAVGVKVASKGHADVRMFFDRETSLLVRAVRRVSEGGLTFEQDFLYGDHKEFDGVRLPAKITESRGGKRFTELGSVSYKFPRTLSDATFNR